MNQTTITTMVVFVGYIAGVFILAGLSHRMLSKRSFMSEYFLGSRGLGTWALAFSFAATSASGGSFGGYPSLIYSYGWVLALWIAGYMIVPLVTMGVIGKRLNQVARKSGAITIPDVFRDRFQSPALGLFSSCVIIFFTICVLVAQFKLGAIIIEDTFNVNFRYGYQLSLAVFALVTIFYTSYGGFRAVVWTDVMQGIVMGLGVVLLLPVVLLKTGGLREATQRLATAPAMAVTSVPNDRGDYNDLVFRVKDGGEPVPVAIRYLRPRQPQAELQVNWDAAGDRVISVSMATDAAGDVTTTANDIRLAIEDDPRLGRILSVEIPYKNEEVVDVEGKPQSLGATGRISFSPGSDNQRYAFRRGGALIFGPGRKDSGAPFHPLGMIISFFFMWPIVGIAQPGMMVRLMAFRDSRTLKRSILTVTIYFAVIYIPLVLIVMAARDALPVLTAEHSDRTIVLIATRLVADMGFGYEILGAILVAAPFAAVMSTVDSFLLIISSAAVRDIYQRSINPQVSQRAVVAASYATTVIAGVLVTWLALRPPQFLQIVVVFVSGGFGATFLFPMLLGLYWSRMTRRGAIAAMVGGFVTVVGFSIPRFLGGGSILLMGFEPTLWGMAVSGIAGVVVSLAAGPPKQELVERYFR